MSLLDCIEIVVENGEFSCYKQMLHFTQWFQDTPVTEVLKYTSVEKRVKDGRICLKKVQGSR